MSLRVYIDTNVLMEHLPLDQLPLEEILGESVDVVVIPFRVVQELVKHKYSPEKRKRRRAEAAEALVGRLRKDPTLPSGAHVEIIRTASFDYAANDLDPESQDDRIMATVISERTERPSDEHILLTADQPLAVLAEQLGVSCVMLGSRYRLVSGDPTDHLPKAKPVLTFDNGAVFLEAEVPLPPDPAQLERDALAKYWTPRSATGSNAAIVAAFATLGGPGAWPRSQGDVVAHAARLGEWARGNVSAVPVELRLGNDGSSPADDLDIFIEYPAAACTPFTRSQLTRYPESQSQWASIAALSHPRLPELEGPFITEAAGGGRTVRYHVERIKQGMSRRLKMLYLVPVDTEHPESFALTYSIISVSLPKPVSGELHVRLSSSGRLDFESLLERHHSED